MAKVALPRYLRVKKTKGGPAFYWEPPHWARKGAQREGRECPVVATALGADLATAVQKAEQLNEALDGWRKGDLSVDSAPGSVTAVFEWYQTTPRFLKTAPKTQSDYRKLMRAVAGLPMKRGVFGQRNAASVDGEAADKIYEKFRERGERQATYAMQVCRLVWNWAGRYTKTTGIPQNQNPFKGMSLNHEVQKGNLAATREQYDLYRETAKSLGFQSMATASALAFELVQRVSDCFGFQEAEEGSDEHNLSQGRGIRWDDYYPPHHITVRQQKTNKFVVIPLHEGFGKDREDLYPELDAELKAAAAQASSKSGLIIVEERNGLPYKPRRMSDVHRLICDTAKLPKDLTFTSFRHGGASELGDAGEVDIRSISGHTQLSTTLIYNKANQVKARRLAKVRRRHIALIRGEAGADE